MKGAIIGDIAGSRFEFEPLKSTDFDLFGRDLSTPGENGEDPAPCRYTDDTVMTAAVADALLAYDALRAEGRTTPLEEILIDSLHAFGNRHLHVGFGHWQYEWLKYRKREPYNSFGNGSAMRVSPVGWYARTLNEALDLAKATAAVTHNHPEGIKGARRSLHASFSRAAGIPRATSRTSSTLASIRASRPSRSMRSGPNTVSM
ncbi:ADP-ribosylglycohydrolase family protein [uncultured Adlercreutzia sp.]|uniref:ADP-ribosylglycohydrolase family protein n=1 Tax=uncultured Adlercreutzia sp. TaxID=875803 RepID=UPI0025EED726|nr:ADP-ribosylglycohydrolase family protein [uncultured Adlercreutzia sp.]